MKHVDYSEALKWIQSGNRAIRLSDKTEYGKERDGEITSLFNGKELTFTIEDRDSLWQLVPKIMTREERKTVSELAKRVLTHIYNERIYESVGDSLEEVFKNEYGLDNYEIEIERKY